MIDSKYGTSNGGVTEHCDALDSRPSVSTAFLERLQLESPDTETNVLYLEIPNEAVVLLQGAFELSEGLGVVRTVYDKTLQTQGSQKPIVAVITTCSQVQSCKELVSVLQHEWSQAIGSETRDQDGRVWACLEPTDPRVAGSVVRDLLPDDLDEET